MRGLECLLLGSPGQRNRSAHRLCDRNEKGCWRRGGHQVRCGLLCCPPGRETLRSRFQVRFHRDRSARNPRAPHSGTEEEAEPRSGGSLVCRSSRTSSRGPRNSWKSTGRRGWDSTRCSRVGTDRPRSSRGGTGCQGSGRLPGPPGLHPGTKTGQERFFDQAALRGARRGDLVAGAAEAISRIHASLGASRPDHLTGFPASSRPWTGMTDMRLNEPVRVAISSLPWTGNSPWLRLPLLSNYPKTLSSPGFYGGYTPFSDSYLADSAGDIGLGSLVLGVGEQQVGGAELGEDAGALDLCGHGLVEHQASGHVADPPCLLHIVGDDDDRKVGLEVVHQVLNACRGDGVEGRARLVHENDLGFDGQGPGNAEPLLLAAGELEAGAMELVLDLVPERRAAQRSLDQVIHVAAVAVDPCSPGNIIVDALGERIGLLENHADAPSQRDRVGARGRDQFTVKPDLPFHPRTGDQVVHAVEAAQERTLAATGGPDDRGDLVAGYVDGDVLEGQCRTIPDREPAGGQDHGFLGPWRWSETGRRCDRFDTGFCDTHEFVMADAKGDFWLSH